MPIIKSAIKKLRKDRQRTISNKKRMALLKKAIKNAKKKPAAESIKKIVSLVDKAAKRHLIHKNKANRLKSQLAKLVKAKTQQKPVAKSITKTKNKAKAVSKNK